MLTRDSTCGTDVEMELRGVMRMEMVGVPAISAIASGVACSIVAVATVSAVAVAPSSGTGAVAAVVLDFASASAVAIVFAILLRRVGLCSVTASAVVTPAV